MQIDIRTNQSKINYPCIALFCRLLKVTSKAAQI
ncbi:hypothetical protein F753_19740 [Stutzerimonas chloritidismutans AW-1]|uniref:Uncharacterized protein n=1 Tax=Stutzerimonas chloritidismutans AW-1 TaxID=1263865 RepID=V4PNJ3_STUCH|nr:hypothetical protein F753_19740 [Stutzerimonas chloritidismutans AW-1]